jgi:hypothetical protein
MQRIRCCFVGLYVTVMLTSGYAMGQSDTLKITLDDGSPLTTVARGREVDYKIGSQPTVFLQPGESLPVLSIEEPAVDGAVENSIVVHVNFYETINGSIMQGPGTRNAWLLEPPPAPDNTLSDRIQAITEVNPTNALMRNYTFTLNSDPIPASIVFAPLPTDFLTVENESTFNLSNYLFFATPGNPNETVPPFRVFVTSDVEVPEPGILMLTSIAIGLLVCRRRTFNLCAYEIE